MKFAAALLTAVLCAGIGMPARALPAKQSVPPYLKSVNKTLDTAADKLAKAQEDESNFYRRLGWDNGRVRGVIDLKTFLPCMDKRRALAKYYADSVETVKKITTPAAHAASHEKLRLYLAAKAQAEGDKINAIDKLLAEWKTSLAADEKTAVFPADKIHQTLNYWPADKTADDLRRDWAVTYNKEAGVKP